MKSLNQAKSNISNSKNATVLSHDLIIFQFKLSSCHIKLFRICNQILCTKFWQFYQIMTSHC